MRMLSTLAALLCAASAVQAASVQRVTAKPHAMNLRRAEQIAQPAEVLDGAGSANASFAGGKIDATLNCENDNVLDPANTLVLDPGDLAGTIFSVPTDPTPYRIAEVSLGVFSFNAPVPSQLDLVILEDDGTGTSFNSIAGFTVDIDAALAPAGEILTVDLRTFDVTGQNDLLILYGDAAGAANALVLPAGDGSPRCLVSSGGTDNVCSVHLPAGTGSLFIYGLVDGAACPSAPSQIQNLDIVIEVLLVPVNVGVEPLSFGAVKARY